MLDVTHLLTKAKKNVKIYFQEIKISINVIGNRIELIAKNLKNLIRNDYHL